MARIESTVNPRGQVSIPARIRQKLGLMAGSKVEWREQGDDVIVRRASKYSSQDIHDALFSVPPHPRSVDDMDEGIAAHLRQEYPRR